MNIPAAYDSLQWRPDAAVEPVLASTDRSVILAKEIIVLELEPGGTRGCGRGLPASVSVCRTS